MLWDHRAEVVIDGSEIRAHVLCLLDASLYYWTGEREEVAQLIGVVGLSLGEGVMKDGPVRGKHGWRQIVESFDLMKELEVFVRV